MCVEINNVHYKTTTRQIIVYKVVCKDYGYSYHSLLEPYSRKIQCLNKTGCRFWKNDEENIRGTTFEYHLGETIQSLIPATFGMYCFTSLRNARKYLNYFNTTYPQCVIKCTVPPYTRMYIGNSQCNTPSVLVEELTPIEHM